MLSPRLSKHGRDGNYLLGGHTTAGVINWDYLAIKVADFQEKCVFSQRMINNLQLECFWSLRKWPARSEFCTSIALGTLKIFYCEMWAREWVVVDLNIPCFNILYALFLRIRIFSCKINMFISVIKNHTTKQVYVLYCIFFTSY